MYYKLIDVGVFLCRFWHETYLLHKFNWSDHYKNIVKFKDDYRVEIEVNCGDQACKFELKTYLYCFGSIPECLLVKKENVNSGGYQSNV